MPSRKVYTEPPEVTLVDGEVVFLGPGRVHGSMTPDAARETGRRLIAGARKARVDKGDKPPRRNDQGG